MSYCEITVGISMHSHSNEPAGSRVARHLVLCGMMGSGKSTVGALCARAIGVPMIDTDELVVAQSGRSVDTIFEELGEVEFRRLEAIAVAQAAAAPDASVIACGGGVMTQAANREALRKTGFVVWLDASVEVLAHRVGSGIGRPLLQGAEPIAVLTRLDTIRRPVYDQCADVRIETSAMSRAETVRAVLDAFEARVINDR